MTSLSLEDKKSKWLRYNRFAPIGILGACVISNNHNEKVSLLDCVHEWEWHTTSETKVPKFMYPYLQEEISRLLPDIKWTQIYEKKEFV